MQHWRTVLLGVLVPIFAVAVILTRGHVQAEHAWDYHWAGQGERTIQLIESVSPEWEPALAAAVAVWNQSPVIEIVVVPDEGAKNCATVLGKARICNASGIAGNYWAYTQVWAPAGGHISRARTVIDDESFVGASPEMRQWIVCHELGHALGLWHFETVQSPPTCMHVNFFASEPNEHDFHELTSIYGHGD